MSPLAGSARRAAATLLRLAAAAGAAWTIGGGAQAQEMDRDIPVCTDADRVPWEAQRKEQVGVQAIDPYPNLMPEAVPGDLCVESVDFSERQDGRATDGIHSWVMASGCKHVLCGRPQSFEHNTSGALLTGEFDLNNNIIPDTTHPSHLVDILERRKCFAPRWQVKAEHSGERERAPASAGPVFYAPVTDHPSLCFPRAETIHAEITPPGSLRRYLRRLWRAETGDWLAWTRRLAEDKACVYGPFVADTGHAAKAEIHPVQMLWWNEKVGRDPDDYYTPDGPYLLFVVQDASSRYAMQQDFVLEHPVPKGGSWRPWAKAPLPGRFEIPFWVRTDHPVQFRIDPIAGTGQTVRPAVPPATVLDGGEVRTLATVFNVAEGVDVETQVLCRRNTTTPAEYLAKLVLTGAVGHDREWEEGYFAVRVTDSRQTPSFRPRGEGQLAPCNRKAPMAAVVAWRPIDKPGFRAVAEARPTDPAIAQRATTRMFKEAGWPFTPSGEPASPHPWPVLLRLDGINVEAEASLACLTEKEEKSLKVRVDWAPATEACDIVDERCDTLAVASRPSRGAALDLNWPDHESQGIPIPGDLSVRTATLDFTVRAALPKEAEQAQNFHSTVWSHAFRAEHDEWVEAATRLCQKLPELPPEPLGTCRPREVQAPKGWLPPSQEIQALVTNLAGDKVMTMTELGMLVQQVCRLCGRAAGPDVHQWVPLK